MTRAEECREFAAQCLRMAQQTRQPRARAELLAMAEFWRQLANEGEPQSPSAEAQGPQTSLAPQRRPG